MASNLRLPLKWPASMNKRPTIATTPQKRPAQGTISRFLTYAGASYEVRLKTVDGSQVATLHLAGTSCERALHPFPDEVPVGLSASAIEAGYVAVAKWLVKTGRFPGHI
jgi:hypothetical protein